MFVIKVNMVFFLISGNSGTHPARPNTCSKTPTARLRQPLTGYWKTDEPIPGNGRTSVRKHLIVSQNTYFPTLYADYTRHFDEITAAAVGIRRQKQIFCVFCTNQSIFGGCKYRASTSSTGGNGSSLIAIGAGCG